jgi:hypothetical protein
MTDQVEVSIMFPPIEPGTPTGPELICGEATSDYETTGSEDATDYSWTLSPEEAGTIMGNGLQATVTWAEGFTGTAMISVFGINDCGDGDPSEALEVTVDTLPNPEIIGEDQVCDNTSEIYSTTQNGSSTFTWVVTGGEIAEGQGTNAITVNWGEAGDGALAVTEETENGCTGSSDTLDVFIDDCTGIGELNTKNEFRIYPNPADQMINVIYSGDGIRDIRIIIFNHLGQMVRTKEMKANKGSNAFEINVEDLTNGLYFIKLQSGNDLLMKKQFIKN